MKVEITITIDVNEPINRQELSSDAIAGFEQFTGYEVEEIEIKELEK